MKKTESTVTGPVRLIKKLNLCKEHVRVLTLTELKPVKGGSIVGWVCDTYPPCSDVRDGT